MHHQHPHRLNVWPFNANANLNQPGANQSMMAAAAAQLHQTQFQLLLQQQLQHQQQELYASYMNSANQKQPQQQQSQPGKFNSPFSVNNLLERAPLQQTTFQQKQQQQNQQILGQYLASAIESYRFQKSAFNQNPTSSGSPKKLKPEFNDQGVATQPNESVCSISSSPSSSSTTSATSLSFDYSHNSTQHHMIDSAALNGNHATGNSERNSPDLLSTSSSVASSSSSSSSSCSSSSASFSCLNNSTNHSKRKRQLSIDLNNLNCPICGLQLNGYSDLKSHLEYELIKLNDESSFVSLIKKNNSANQNEEAYLQKNPRYLKYLEIKENRRKREITKSKQRSTTASKELDCHRRKRSYEDEDNLLTNTGSETNSKRLKPTTINNGNIYEDNDEEQINNNTEDPYINVVDEDVDEDVVDDEVAAETLSQHNDSMDEFNDNRQHQHSTSIHDSTNFSEESENLNQSNDSKCQLCSESFKNVYVSVKCWHAFCRKCWGKSINTTKRCPQSQCNLETSIKELRKVNV